MTAPHIASGTDLWLSTAELILIMMKRKIKSKHSTKIRFVCSALKTFLLVQVWRRACGMSFEIRLINFLWDNFEKQASEFYHLIFILRFASITELDVLTIFKKNDVNYKIAKICKTIRFFLSGRWDTTIRRHVLLTEMSRPHDETVLLIYVLLRLIGKSINSCQNQWAL